MIAPKLLAVVPLLSGAVFAAPAPAVGLTDANGAPVLFKRGEGIHLMNCEYTGSVPSFASLVVVCSILFNVLDLSSCCVYSSFSHERTKLGKGDDVY